MFGNTDEEKERKKADKDIKIKKTYKKSMPCPYHKEHKRNCIDCEGTRTSKDQ